MGAYDDSVHYLQDAASCVNRTSTMYDMVKEFMEKHDQLPHQYQSGNYDIADGVPELRAKLILEEAIETVTGLGYDIIPFNGGHIHSHKDLTLKYNPNKDSIGGMVDGCIDLLYVVLGTLIAYGIPDVIFFEDVHAANMTKATIKDEHGKVSKDGTERKPKTREILRLLEFLNVATKS